MSNFSRIFCHLVLIGYFVVVASTQAVAIPTLFVV
jgi:hypothetical protein